MHFLNTTTLRLEDVPDADLQSEENQYAILSHRWGRDEDEVTYQEMLSSADVSSKRGFAKIKEFCRVASSENCRYGWVDTCCIHKGDSAELTEAINSMYLWYKCSKVCIVYLGDVQSQQPITDSEWFDRGWTLQELIAPKDVRFFDQTWNFVGTKTGLLIDLSRKTRIPVDVLSQATPPSSCSVAQRMSWAADRITKRVEDRAYSLMGLFGVYMPMIYGEREQAFRRLQKLIVSMCKDESVFAWAMEHSDYTPETYSGLYAPSPSVYKGCDRIVPVPGSSGVSEVGGELSLSTEILRYTPGTYRAMLHCADTAYPSRRVGIMVVRTSKVSNTFVRVAWTGNPSRELFPISSKRIEQVICVPLDPSGPTSPPVPVYYGFWLRTLQPPGHEESQITILSNRPTPEPDYICQDYPEQGNTGVVRITPSDGLERSDWSQIRWIKFGFSREYQPILWLGNNSQSNRLDEPFELALEPQISETRSVKHRQAMREDLLEASRGDPIQHLHYEWPEGRLILQVYGTELRDFVIPKLNLKISVRLQPFNSPGTPPSGTPNGLRIPAAPMLVWVVDIVSMEGDVGSLSRDEMIGSDNPGSDCCTLLFSFICCCPCTSLFCCVARDEERDLLYLPHAAARRQTERAKQRKEEYLRRAHSRLPLLETRKDVKEEPARLR